MTRGAKLRSVDRANDPWTDNQDVHATSSSACRSRLTRTLARAGTACLIAFVSALLQDPVRGQIERRGDAPALTLRGARLVASRVVAVEQSARSRRLTFDQLRLEADIAMAVLRVNCLLNQ